MHWNEARSISGSWRIFPSQRFWRLKSKSVTRELSLRPLRLTRNLLEGPFEISLVFLCDSVVNNEPWPTTESQRHGGSTEIKKQVVAFHFPISTSLHENVRASA